MKLGVCRGLDDFESLKIAAQSGVDYLETGFGCFVDYNDEKINCCKEVLESLSLRCLAANGFIPGDMKLVGDNVDYVAISDYLDRGFERLKNFDVEKIVLGSGRARSFEDGYSLEKAKEQLAFFLSEYAAPRAEKAGCAIVLEPLRFCESTMIHMVSDGVDIARMSGARNVSALADLYHVYGNNDSIDGIAGFKGRVLHSHIAEPITRVYPSLSDNEEIKSIYKSFFDALKIAGCETCSIEARTDDFSKDIVGAIKVLKNCL